METSKVINQIKTLISELDLDNNNYEQQMSFICDLVLTIPNYLTNSDIQEELILLGFID